MDWTLQLVLLFLPAGLMNPAALHSPNRGIDALQTENVDMMGVGPFSEQLRVERQVETASKEPAGGQQGASKGPDSDLQGCDGRPGACSGVFSNQTTRTKRQNKPNHRPGSFAFSHPKMASTTGTWLNSG